jgi:hypothetical protein
MSVFGPGFSERVFEFGFNAEFAYSNKAVLAGAPHIPTQNQEKYLGYDAHFAIKAKGGAVHSVALQHKVSRHVTGSSGTNVDFRNAAGIPYYAFRIDVDQYNLIESIASAGLPGLEFYYCAPRFSTVEQMNLNYMTQSVMSNSTWINVAGAGQIIDLDPHTMVYSATGASAWICSEPREAKVVPPRPALSQELRESLPDLDVRETYSVVNERLRAYWPRRRSAAEREHESSFLPATLPRSINLATSSEHRVFLALSALLSKYYGVSWLVQTRT